MMVRIVLIRPGSTDFDEQGRIKGTLDIPLNDHGADQVARTIAALSGMAIEAVYASPGQPAEQTAAAIADGLGAKVKIVEKLRNLDHGLWQGKQIEEVKLKQPKVYRRWQENPETMCPPEGETLSAARRRVGAAVDKILKKHRSGVVGLVAPEPLASVVRDHLMPGKLGDLWKAECVCGSWESFDIEPKDLVAP
jgi:broad specificity phosphatase PhoE